MDFGAAETILLAVVGATIGSFLNVVAHRLPRGMSLGGRSFCPGCATQIRAWDNVPIISFVLLRGRCRDCQTRISIRYPLVEALTALLYAAVALRASNSAELVGGLVLITTLVAVAVIDLEHRIVPNRILAPAALAAAAVYGLLDPGRLPENAIAAVAAGTALLVPALLYPQGMGMGDVKLAAVLGLFLGRAVAPALFAGFLAGSLVGIAIVLSRGASARKHAIAFAPYLALGGVVGQLFGEDIVDWYLGGPF